MDQTLLLKSEDWLAYILLSGKNMFSNTDLKIADNKWVIFMSWMYLFSLVLLGGKKKKKKYPRRQSREVDKHSAVS